MICIVDGPYLTYRAFAIAGPDDPVQAQAQLYKSTISVVLELLKDMDDVIIVWEHHKGIGSELRRQDFPDYKMNREPKPLAYLEALSVVQPLLLTLGASGAMPMQGEADDAAATLCWRYRDTEPVCLWCRDKDWFQLLDHPAVSCRLPPLKGLHGWTDIGAAGVVAKLGVEPELVPSYLALVGDTADGFPGVAGIGPGRAQRLLQAEPAFVELIVAGQGQRALQSVQAKDASLVTWARKVVDQTDHVRAMFACAHLRRVELHERQGAFDRDLAEGMLRGLNCEWAIRLLDDLPGDDWSDGPGDDWSL